MVIGERKRNKLVDASDDEKKKSKKPLSEEEEDTSMDDMDVIKV